MFKSKDEKVKYPTPQYRRLRAFAFDPILSQRIGTQQINEIVIKLPWDDDLAVGPIDDYLEVVDFDPASQAFYAPVDLNNPLLLAQDGLAPSEGTPQFHQQMVYAVARNTIRHFEKALGRCAFWSPRGIDNPEKLNEEFVQRLRIYPHALRQANAYYSPDKKALLFGYFPASATDPGENLPGGMIFTCLSHDIVAHETTHALLDGLHRHFIEPSNIDVWALHEAFADIVALFQHFSYPGVLRDQIAKTRGDLEKQSLLGELAFQFGQAVGHYGALRSAIGEFDKDTGEWIPNVPDPHEIDRVSEPHARGAILVAAVFEAFLIIYKRRIRDLLRIATSGTGILQPGDIHPDLVERLAQEASKTAGHILNICIRALDYCPPVDVDFGDYLRALITADSDLVSNDRYNYRLAFIEAFRHRGIYPHDVRNLSEESLRWMGPNDNDQKIFEEILGKENLDILVSQIKPNSNRKQIYEDSISSRKKLSEWLRAQPSKKVEDAFHLVLEFNDDNHSLSTDEEGEIAFDVHSVRPTRRITADGDVQTDIIIEITQSRMGYSEESIQEEVDRGHYKKKGPLPPDFYVKGGCTLIIDQQTAKVRYCVYKNVMSQNRLNRIRRYLAGITDPTLATTYFGSRRREILKELTSPARVSKKYFGREPFNLLHRAFEEKEEKHVRSK
jgi:hypothetical protein